MEIEEFVVEDPRIDLTSPSSQAPTVDNESHRAHKRTSKACLPCRRIHLSCDNQRPCSRCVNRKNVKCVEGEPRKKRSKKKKTEGNNNSSILSVDPQNANYNQLSGAFQSNSLTSSFVPSNDLNAAWDEFDKFISENGGWPNLLDSNPIDVPTPSRLSPFPSNIPDEFNLFSYTKQELQDLIDFFKTRTGEPPNKNTWDQIYNKITNLGQFISEEQRIQLQNDFEKDLEIVKRSSEKMQVPIVVQGRHSSVYYYNDAFKQLTGVDFECPTPLRTFTMANFLDDQTLRNLKMIIGEI
eukprot:TRINITY_DN3795_c0_g1_i1.p1 TRINITY_DN3795_c0_g1~~TRINITY_DN3795_c0_g1_i1.p1  ORF type:complete len:296 (+),score=60.31 TRINITY_DN3795_c0_g1_i1:35-922(+)